MPPKEIKNREQNSVKLDANNNSRLVAEQSSSIPFRSKKLSYSIEKITWSSNSSLSSSSTSSSSPTKTGGIKLNNPVSETSKPILRICGNLEKMSLSGLKLWRKRYFVLTDNILQYFSDPSKSKHCGTIFLSGTYTRPTIKKDGSASNKKYSFKVDMIRSNLNQSVSRVSTKNNDCAYFAADSLEHMNEWINYFNLASQIKANNRSRGDKSQFGKTSHGSSIRSSSSESVNHVTSDHNGTLANHEPSKRSISAPNSPMAAKHSITFNENANTIHPSNTIQTMPSSSRRSQSSNSRSNKEIYESFEKPIKYSANDRQKSVIVNLVRSTNNTDSADTSKKSNMDREKITAATIAANNAAAAAIAKEKEKSRLMSLSAGQKPINTSYLAQKQQHMDQTDNSINMFYNLSMHQMDILPKIIEKLFKNQAITHSKELPNGVHLLNQLNSLNHNMELLQSQLAEFNLILNDSMRQQNERQQLSHVNGAEMYSHLFLNNPTPQNGEEDFNQNESVKINPNPNPNPIGFNQHLRSGFKPVNESRSVNFKRDLLLTNGNNMRPLVGKIPSNYYSQSQKTMIESKSNELLFKPIPIKSYQPLSNANKIFAANNMRVEASQFEIQKAFMDSQLEDHSENPETKLNPSLSQIINDLAHQNEMEYFDIDQYGKDLVNILYPEKEFRINEIS